MLLTVLAVIFWADSHPKIGRIFKVIPALVFCYFVPTTLTALGVIPSEAPMYEWGKQFVLPAGLLLLTLALDVKGIYRLGFNAHLSFLIDHAFHTGALQRSYSARKLQVGTYVRRDW